MTSFSLTEKDAFIPSFHPVPVCGSRKEDIRLLALPLFSGKVEMTDFE